MEADRIATPLQHGALEIVVEQDPRHPVPGRERADMAAQEALHAGVEEEAQKDLARVAQHHDERHQRTAGAADLQVAEMRPIDLRLLAGQAAQPQIGLRRAARPMLGDEMAEVIGAAAIAALARHREQAAGGQRRELLQRLADQRQVGVDLRRPRLPRRSRAVRPAPARGAPRCGGRAAAGRWCRPSTSRRGSSAGSAPRSQAASPWRPGPRPVVSNTEAMTPAATQEPLPEQGRQPRPHQWQCGPDGRGLSASRTLVARGRHRVRRQQIIAPAARVNRDASLSSCRAR